MFLPKVNKSADTGLTKNIKKVVASVLMAAALVIPSAEASTYAESNTASITSVAPQSIGNTVILLHEFNTKEYGSAYHYSHSSHSSHYSHSSHRSHYSHYSGY